MLELGKLAGKWAGKKMYAASEKNAPAQSVLKWLGMPLLMANEGFAKEVLRDAALLSLINREIAREAWARYADPADARAAWDGVRLFARYLNYWRNAAQDAATLQMGPGSEKARAAAKKEFEANCACALEMLDGPARACYRLCFSSGRGDRLRQAETEMRKAIAEIGILAGKMEPLWKDKYAAAAGNLLACAPADAASRLFAEAEGGRLGKLGMAALVQKALLGAACSGPEPSGVSKPRL